MLLQLRSLKLLALFTAALAVPIILCAQTSPPPSANPNASTQQQSFELDLTERWMNTELWVAAGERISIIADGEMNWFTPKPERNWRGCPPGSRCISTVDGPPNGSCPDMRNFIAPNLMCWSLIGRIGNHPAFQLGSTKEFIAPASGELFLGVNDNNYWDNTGNWEATITTCKPPNQQVRLPVTPHHQEATNWCWAAVGQMTMNYLRPSLNLSQCEEANQEFNRDDCCRAPNSAECNRRGFPRFKEYGFDFTSSTDGPLPFEAIEAEIGCGRRPVAAFWKHRWSDAAHLVLAVGYDPNLDGMQQVLVIDPEESLTNDNVITRWIPYRNFFAIRQFIGGWAESSSFDLYGIVDSGKDGFEQ